MGHTDEQATCFYRDLSATVAGAVEESEQTEQAMLLSAILGSTVQLDRGERRTVGELLVEPGGTEVALNRFGIRRLTSAETMGLKDWQRAENHSEEPHVFLDTSASGQLRRSILRDTEYGRKNLRTILSRLPCAVKAICRLSSSTPRGVLIPQSVIGSADVREFGPSGIDSDLTGI